MKKMISSFLVVVLIMVLLCACTTSPASLPVSPIENDLQGTWCYKENYSEYSFTFDNGKFTETVKVGSLESTTVGTYEIDEADEKIVCTANDQSVTIFIRYSYDGQTLTVKYDGDTYTKR